MYLLSSAKNPFDRYQTLLVANYKYKMCSVILSKVLLSFFSKSYFSPKNSKISSFPPFFCHILPLIFTFFLISHHIFPLTYQKLIFLSPKPRGGGAKVKYIPLQILYRVQVQQAQLRLYRYLLLRSFTPKIQRKIYINLQGCKKNIFLMLLFLKVHIENF